MAGPALSSACREVTRCRTKHADGAPAFHSGIVLKGAVEPAARARPRSAGLRAHVNRPCARSRPCATIGIIQGRRMASAGRRKRPMRLGGGARALPVAARQPFGYTLPAAVGPHQGAHMMTMPTIVADQLGKHLADDFRRLFGSSHLDQAERSTPSHGWPDASIALPSITTWSIPSSSPSSDGTSCAAAC